MKIGSTQLDHLRRTTESMVHILAVCPHVYDRESSTYTLYFSSCILKVKTSLKDHTISLYSAKDTRFGDGPLLTEDVLRIQITGFRIDESSDKGMFDSVEFHISDDPEEAQANAFLVRHFLGEPVEKPTRISDRGVGFSVRSIESSDGHSVERLRFKWFVGKFAISTCGEITSDAPKVRKLDHTANRRMLASIRKFLEQAQVRARLNVVNYSRVIAASDAFRSSPYPTSEEVITDLFCRYLKAEDITPEDMDLLFALAVREARLAHVFNHTDVSSLSPWSQRAVSNVFTDHEHFKKLIQRLHNRAKERIRIKMGVVTFEQE